MVDLGELIGVWGLQVRNLAFYTPTLSSLGDVEIFRKIQKGRMQNTNSSHLEDTYFSGRTTEERYVPHLRVGIFVYSV